MSRTVSADRAYSPHHPESPLTTHDGLIWTVDRARMVSPCFILDRMVSDCRMLRHLGHFGTASPYLIELGWTASQVARFLPRALARAVVNSSPLTCLPEPPPAGVPALREFLETAAKVVVLGLLLAVIALLCPSAGHAAEVVQATAKASIAGEFAFDAAILLTVLTLAYLVVPGRRAPPVEPYADDDDFGDQPAGRF